MIVKVGSKFNRLTVNKVWYKCTKLGNKYKVCECICDCGTIAVINATALTRRTRPTISCGCYRKEILEARATHGESHKEKRTDLFTLWCSIKSRCYGKNREDYKYYGGRGITITNKWKNDYLSFKAWALKNGYKKGLEIDRINNDLDYSESNCRFITHAENMRNTSRNRYITAFGETKCISEWGRDARCKVTRKAIEYRLDVNKWCIEKAITEPAGDKQSVYD